MYEFYRYPVGGIDLQYFAQWVKETLNVDLTKINLPQEVPSSEQLPQPRITSEQLALIKNLGVSFSTEGIERLIRCHGQTLKEIYTLRQSQFQRIPDVVLWPKCHADVERIINMADTNNIVVIPYGGGTSVSGAIECPQDEQRTILSLDTSQMNRILWVCILCNPCIII